MLVSREGILCALFLWVPICVADDAPPAAERTPAWPVTGFKSSAALTAEQRYHQATLAAANAFRRKIAPADHRLISDLDEAMHEASRAGNTDEVANIKQVKEAAVEAQAAHSGAAAAPSNHSDLALLRSEITTGTFWYCLLTNATHGREIQFLKDGSIGKGEIDEHEQRWTLRPDGTLAIGLNDGTTTMTFTHQLKGVWSGRWIVDQKYPVMLVTYSPDDASAQNASASGDADTAGALPKLTNATALKAQRRYEADYEPAIAQYRTSVTAADSRFISDLRDASTLARRKGDTEERDKIEQARVAVIAEKKEHAEAKTAEDIKTGELTPGSYWWIEFNGDRSAQALRFQPDGTIDTPPDDNPSDENVTHDDEKRWVIKPDGSLLIGRDDGSATASLTQRAAGLWIGRSANDSHFQVMIVPYGK